MRIHRFVHLTGSRVGIDRQGVVFVFTFAMRDTRWRHTGTTRDQTQEESYDVL